ncbi:MAG: zinc-dependent alcohol dehydrogenase [Catenisphaera adipataccumulans]|jgi:threonine dehydrogenase-like Zn-dependent dehydrogenase|uniref:zinc-dependent alcohol dehydrogenase n=1 Tax=Catenisphaera adipataccumulans TaxID=700500 RepID=UPI003D910789
MKVCVLTEPGTYELQDVPIPKIKNNEVLLRVLTSGVCVNDVRDFKGSKWSLPRIGGHEYCGVVEKIGDDVDVDEIHIGDHAIPYIVDDCGVCPECKHHHENICSNFTKGTTYYNPDGFSGFKGFSEYVAVPARHLYIYPKETPDDEAAFTEPLACVINSIQRSQIKMGDDVVVIGGGVMGMLHVLCAKKQGARVIVSEPDNARRAFAQKLGADIVIDPMASDPVKQIRDITHGHGADVVEDTTALPAVAEQALEMTAKGGMCNFFSSIHPNEPIQIDAGRIHSQEIRVTGTENGTIETFARAIDCIAKGIIDVKPLIEKVYPYTQVQEALEFASRPDTYKVMLEFSK